MVLGTSEVHVIDMVSAFASIANKGVKVTPYGITKVTANGQTIYTHEVDRSRVLVAPYVAAQMTDLLQTAVNTGTGRAAQIGRPVAGKTGTTTSSKDGWFLGFSSGITTGVWMGRDNGKPVAGLHGGTAPAKAFADYMRVAVANRPIEQFETQVTLPEWQLEPDEESYFGEPDNGVAAVDADGNPLPSPTAIAPEDGSEAVEIPTRREPGGPAPIQQPGGAGQPQPAPVPPAAPQQRLDQAWIDRVTGRGNGAAPREGRSNTPPRGLPRDRQGERQDDRPNQ